MPLSLKCKLKKLKHKGVITESEFSELIKKLEGHDRELVTKMTRNILGGIICQRFDEIKGSEEVAGKAVTNDRLIALLCSRYSAEYVWTEEKLAEVFHNYVEGKEDGKVQLIGHEPDEHKTF